MNNILKIVNYLAKHHENAFTMHELSNILNIPYASFYRTVQKENDLLNIQLIGKSKVIRINNNNDVIKSYLAIASYKEKVEFLKNQTIIRLIHKDMTSKDIILLFGSYAKGIQNKSSDIDLLIINKEGKKTISFKKYELLYKIKINPIFITKKEFMLMMKDEEENVGKQALKNHIILNNPEKFWSVLYG